MFNYFDLEYQHENTEILCKYRDLVFDTNNNIVMNYGTYFHNKLGEQHSRFNHYHYGIRKNPLDFEYVQTKLPRLFSLLSGFQPNKKIIYDWMALIGYKNNANFLGEHIHRPPIQWVGIYYLDDRPNGTEIWDDENEKWVTLENKNSRLYIISADTVHRFIMMNDNKSRIVLSINFYFE